MPGHRQPTRLSRKRDPFPAVRTLPRIRSRRRAALRTTAGFPRRCRMLRSLNGRDHRRRTRPRGRAFARAGRADARKHPPSRFREIRVAGMGIAARLTPVISPGARIRPAARATGAGYGWRGPASFPGQRVGTLTLASRREPVRGARRTDPSPILAVSPGVFYNGGCICGRPVVSAGARCGCRLPCRNAVSDSFRCSRRSCCPVRPPLPRSGRRHFGRRSPGLRPTGPSPSTTRFSAGTA